MAELSILLVDNDLMIRPLLKQLLLMQSEVSTVHTANNGQEALDLAAQHEPDLVVIDLFLPGLSGLDAIPRLRKLLPETTGIIAVSIQDEEVYGKAAIEAGADAFVSKMETARDLLPAIHRVVQKRRPLPDPSSTSSGDEDQIE